MESRSPVAPRFPERGSKAGGSSGAHCSGKDPSAAVRRGSGAWDCAQGRRAAVLQDWTSWSKLGLVQSILLTMSTAATPVPLSEAKARLSELARRVRQQHERITLTRNGEPEAVLLSVDDLEGLEMTLEILGDADAVARISESLAALERGEPGADMATVRQDLARRRATGR